MGISLFQNSPSPIRCIWYSTSGLYDALMPSSTCFQTEQEARQVGSERRASRRRKLKMGGFKLEIVELHISDPLPVIFPLVASVTLASDEWKQEILTCRTPGILKKLPITGNCLMKLNTTGKKSLYNHFSLSHQFPAWPENE